MSIHDLLNKMESAEQAFLETEFMAPVLPDGRVRRHILRRRHLAVRIRYGMHKQGVRRM